jgi:hypothetical protein
MAEGELLRPGPHYSPVEATRGSETRTFWVDFMRRMVLVDEINEVREEDLYRQGWLFRG